MKLRLKKTLVCLLAAAMLMTLLPVSAMAGEAIDDTVLTYADNVEITAKPITPEAQELPENDELFAMYAEQKLYGYDSAVFGTAAREYLNDAEKAIYDALKTQIETVAANGGSTAFVLTDLGALKTEWTREELGVDSITDTSLIVEAFNAQFSAGNIMNALLCDCPFDLYWFDKTNTGGMKTSFGMSRAYYTEGGENIYVSAVIVNLTFTFSVALGYQGADNTTVTSNVSKVEIAKNNAMATVEAHSAKSSYEKLVSYKDEICALTSYNHEAVENSYTGGYGDPWQLIYVFDGDDETNVVCEGYAKAFQYLCDLGGETCIIATGMMSGGTGAGSHMWNIATLDGENYLVDVTNCDEGAIGAPDALFLVGNDTGSPNTQYSFLLHSQTIAFAYDEDTLSSWPVSTLTLSVSDYTPEITPEATLKASSLTLDGTIGMNFYFDLNEPILESGNALVRFTLENGTTAEIPVSEAQTEISDGKTLYVFTCHLTSKEMSDTVSVQLIMGEEYSSETFQYSVKEYATTILENELGLYTDNDIAMVKAMLNYGAYAQLQFNYNVTDLANDVDTLMTEEEKSVSDVEETVFDAYKILDKNADALGAFMGSNLVLDSETTLRVYFKPASEAIADTLTFLVNGIEITPTQSGGYLVISITNIHANALDDVFDVTVTDGTIEYHFSCSPFSYCNSVFANGTYPQELENVLKAMYLYNQAAINYTNS